MDAQPQKAPPPTYDPYYHAIDRGSDGKPVPRPCYDETARAVLCEKLNFNQFCVLYSQIRGWAGISLAFPFQKFDAAV